MTFGSNTLSFKKPNGVCENPKAVGCSVYCNTEFHVNMRNIVNMYKQI